MVKTERNRSGIPNSGCTLGSPDPHSHLKTWLQLPEPSTAQRGPCLAFGDLKPPCSAAASTVLATVLTQLSPPNKRYAAAHRIKQLKAELSNLHLDSPSAVPRGTLGLHGPQGESQWPRAFCWMPPCGHRCRVRGPREPRRHWGMAELVCGPHALCPSGVLPSLRVCAALPVCTPEKGNIQRH